MSLPRHLRFTCAEDFDLDVFLDRLGRKVSVSAPDSSESEERYYDTPLASLRAAGLCARYLETPDESRVEIQAVPLDPTLRLPGAGPRAELAGHEDPARTLQRLARSSLPIRFDGSLVEHLSVHTHRERRKLQGKGLRAELDLDRVEVHGNGHGGRLGFRRLGLTLVEGDRGSLRRLGRVLEHFPSLRPERGAAGTEPIRLLGHERKGRRRRQRIAAGDDLGRVARRCCAALLDEMLEHEAGTRAGLDPERLHKMRVGTRRLRAAMRLFAPAFRNELLRYLSDDLRWLASRLGAVRDLDVQIMGLPERKRALRAGTEDEWRQLLRRLDERRRRARRELLAALDGDRYRALIAALRHGFVEARAPVVAGTPVGPLAAKALAKSIRKLRHRLAEACRTQDPATVHAARIETKRCRYVAERIAPLLGRKVRRSLSRLGAFQDSVGELQDGVVFGHLVGELAREARSEAGEDDGFLLLLGRLDGFCRSRSKEVASHCREAVADHDVAAALRDLDRRRKRLERRSRQVRSRKPR